MHGFSHFVDIGAEIIIAGTTDLLRCDRSCNVSFHRVMWYKNGSPLDLSQTRYGLARNGMLLYLERVTPADSGEYTCEVQIGETTYQRYCRLEVLDSQRRNSPTCCRPVIRSDHYYIVFPVSCSFRLRKKLHEKAVCSQRKVYLRWTVSMAGYALFSTSWSALWRSPGIH